MADRPPPLAFTAAEAESAWQAWSCNCGPSAIAAVFGMTLDALRPHLGDFEAKRYTNPTLMWSILDRLGARWHLRKDRDWPVFGLARIQWEGPWTQPGVPRAARYRYTHWVGSCLHPSRGPGVFDVNAMASGGWIRRQDWSSSLVPWLLGELYPRASGAWHITHAVEIDG